MPKPKSILQRIEIDIVKKSHNCQHNRHHRLEPGEKRLKVHKNRSFDHYCIACALQIIERDMAKLQSLADEFKEE